ncbi:M28 family peptidase [Chitinophaga solisilvae]|uniref:M28 family peptidase n=1 Tax=Chitinophaga solisilvae TaxID=1233460 RepID=UPI00136E21C3|nr:M28 family peptidase [Chitinophaga solisilvae]
MKTITWLLPLVSITMFVSAQKKSDRKTLSNLQLHINYLSSDKLEGRKSGAPGEQLAAAYISSQLQQLNVAPRGDSGFMQTFTIKEGREAAANCSMKINHELLTAGKQFIPLPFSPDKSAKGEVLPDANEPDNIWLININELEADNKKTSLEQYYQQTQIAAKSGATGVIFYNGKETAADAEQWSATRLPATAIPAVWVNTDISRKLSSEDATTFLIEMQLAFKKVKHTGTNVIGFIDNKAAKTVIIGAHYDHAGTGFRGADDNASGIAALLEITRLLKSSSVKNHNFLIVAFSGKEQGLSGSRYFTAHSPVDLAQVNYMINLDMIGRLDPAKGLQIGGVDTSPGWPGIIGSIAARETKLVYEPGNTGTSDHASFYKKNIPVLYLCTGSHHDTPASDDSADKINYDGALTVVKLVYDIIGKTDNMEKLAFNSK